MRNIATYIGFLNEATSNSRPSGPAGKLAIALVVVLRDGVDITTERGGQQGDFNIRRPKLACWVESEDLRCHI
jgi:hypothetical protein